MNNFPIVPVTVTIANNQQTSGEADLTSGRSVVAVETPASLTGTTFTFTACPISGGTFLPLYDITGSAYSITVGSSRHIPVNPADFAGVRFLKVVSGSAETGAKIITLLTREV